MVHHSKFRSLPQETKIQMVGYRQFSFSWEVITSLRDDPDLHRVQDRNVGCVYVRLDWLQPREGDQLSGASIPPPRALFAGSLA